MKKLGTSRIKKSCIFGVLFMLFSLSAYAVEFSADMVHTMDGKTTMSKVYITGNKMRMETDQDGQKAVMINDYQNRKVIILMPDEKMYMEMPIQGSDANDPEYKEQIESLAESKSLGKETVNGYVCEKIQYVYHDKELGTVTMWYSAELNYYIKIKAKDMEMELKNIQVGTLSRDLFTVPPGYSEMGGFNF
jgi:hypothetical protein